MTVVIVDHRLIPDAGVYRVMLAEEFPPEVEGGEPLYGPAWDVVFAADDERWQGLEPAEIAKAQRAEVRKAMRAQVKAEREQQQAVEQALAKQKASEVVMPGVGGRL